MDSLQELHRAMRAFAEERDWHQYHSPKNLAMALCGEIGELAQHFQWLTEEESKHFSAEKRRAVAQEMADVQLYLILLADALELDLIEEARNKMRINAERYPVAKSRSRSAKYTEL